MNERIKELELQAYVEVTEPWRDPSSGYVYEITGKEFSREKFAELIVKECVGQIQPMWNRVQEIGPPPGYDYDTFELAYNDCMNAIREHFGVE